MATAAGPLCEEPMHCVAVVLRDVCCKQAPDGHVDLAGPVGGQLSSALRVAARSALLLRSARLVEPLYLCDVRVTAELLGKIYAILGARRAVIVSEQLDQGTPLFAVQARLPVVESFGFAEALLRKTGGAASVSMLFDSYADVPADPRYRPRTAAQMAEHASGSSDIPPETARELVDAVRRRKGLRVLEQLVVHADKQRTRSRKK
eukprot:TRINITY_DN2606_c0_g2_i1.p2 TRINITY_DN2606_c0_g2~~TRINITY_DN2606_c0_g2_i1.p2  ORF type:complete len:205 (-),score=67.81 TRINITY_DN2606_c0_g2_i1:6-620(-)